MLKQFSLHFGTPASRQELRICHNLAEPSVPDRIQTVYNWTGRRSLTFMGNSTRHNSFLPTQRDYHINFLCIWCSIIQPDILLLLLLYFWSIPSPLAYIKNKAFTLNENTDYQCGHFSCRGWDSFSFYSFSCSGV